MVEPTWELLAARQAGVLAHAQLHDLSVSKAFIKAQVDARRWARRTPNVLTTTTGPLDLDQRLWLAALHAGGESLIGGPSAAGRHGLKRWDRDHITVLVDQESSFEPVEGVEFFRTRRSLKHLRDPASSLPLCRVEPAILLFAGHERHPRTALGAVSACVQQGLTTA